MPTYTPTYLRFPEKDEKKLKSAEFQEISAKPP